MAGGWVVLGDGMNTPMLIRVVHASAESVCLNHPTRGRVDIQLRSIVVRHENVRGRVAIYDGVVYHTSGFPYDVATWIADGDLVVDGIDVKP